ncbi:MAG: hypothetical protein JEY94_17755 [Melioribacteraceae bacterium]|nr:hypothetical protein [Melioribacteraceae bacterium]
MIKKIIFMIVFIAICVISTNSAQEKLSYTSNLFGDTLSIFENNYFHIFNKIDGFQYAVFFLMPNDSLDVKITYLKNSAFIDTLLKNKFEKNSFEEFFEQNKKLRALSVTGEETNYNDADRAMVKIYYKENSQSPIKGMLLAVKANSIIITIQENYAELKNRLEIDKKCLLEINFEDISVVEKRHKQMGFGTMTLIGGGLFALLGFVQGDDPPGWFTMSAEKKAMSFGILGGLLGLIYDIINEIYSDEDKFYLTDPKDVKELGEYVYPFKSEWLYN